MRRPTDTPQSAASTFCPRQERTGRVRPVHDRFAQDVGQQLVRVARSLPARGGTWPSAGRPGIRAVRVDAARLPDSDTHAV